MTSIRKAGPTPAPFTIVGTLAGYPSASCNAVAMMPAILTTIASRITAVDGVLQPA